MASRQATAVLGHIRKLVAVQNAKQLSDRELLRRFVDAHDEAAFAALMHRHGPMVLSACQRILHRTADAEDACQATFLVLARKAASERWHESIANWLYGVARRLVQALLAAEDKDFYAHRGYSAAAMIRAGIHGLTSSEPEGGATITQWLRARDRPT